MSFSAPGGVILQGAMLGCGIGLLAVGLVLVYRSTRIVNFAYGAMGGYAAAVGVSLHLGRGWPWPACIAAAVITGVATGIGVEWIVIRRFRRSSRLTLTVATIGLAQVLGGMELLVPRVLGGQMIVGAFDTPLNATKLAVTPVIITGNDLLLVAVVPIVLGALSWFLMRTDAGVAVRGIAENTERARLLGIPADRLSTLVWGIAGALAALTVVLQAPSQGLILDAAAGPQLLLPALAAAVVARMEDLRKAFVAGVALGIVDQVVRWNVDKQSASTLVFLAVIVGALALQRRGGARGADTDDAWAATPRLRMPAALAALPQVRRSRIALLGAGLVLAVALPLLVSPSQLNRASSAIVLGIVALSLVLLTGWGGSVSLGQFAIAGAGGLVTANLVSRWDVDFFVTLLASANAGALVALILGLPALRVRGLYLAVTTLAFAVTIDSFVLNPVNFPGLIPDSYDRPVLWARFDLASESTLYELCLAVLVATLVLVWGWRRARPGRVLLAGRDNPRAVAAAGVNPVRSRVGAFMTAGLMAGVAGSLNAVLLGGVGYHTYEPSMSILVFAMAVIGGLESLGGALLGVAVVELVAFVFPEFQLIITGAGLLLILLGAPRGLGEIVRAWAITATGRVARARGLIAADDEPSVESHRPVPAATTVSSTSSTPTPLPPPGPLALDCRGVTASYGPMQVLFGIDLWVQRGEMVALLGTNGAGKSTVLRCLTGLLRPDAGTLVLTGQGDRGTAAPPDLDLTAARPEDIARRGIALMPGGRGLFPGLTVAENLRLAGWMIRHDHAARRHAQTRAFELFGVLRDRLDLRAGELSGGEQQMLSLAMAITTDPEVLCIDELSLGLAPAIVADLVRLVRRIHASGTTVVVVEQSVNVALLLAERAVFLERGRVRFSGAAEDLLARPDILRAVFIGEAPIHGNGPVHAPSRATPTGADPPRVLECRDLTKRYGGITAVDGVSLMITPGRIVGLIGHNGAGKTSLFDLLSGFTRPDGGRILLGGIDITDDAPHRRAVAGLGRSFQEARLYPSLTVAETVAVALDRHLANREPLAAALALPVSVDSERDGFARVDEILATVGLTPYRRHLIAELSTGTRRIVELACILAQQPAVVLLDEPTAGVAQRDTEALGPRLREVQAATGCSLLVIEHDMNLLTDLCDELVALELGQVIARGTSDAVLSHPRVVASYLGTDAATISRSDRAQPALAATSPSGH